MDPMIANVIGTVLGAVAGTVTVELMKEFGPALRAHAERVIWRRGQRGVNRRRGE